MEAHFDLLIRFRLRSSSATSDARREHRLAGHTAGFYGFLGGATPSTAAAHPGGNSTGDLRAINRR